MKIVTGLFILLAAVGSSWAQDAKVIAELTASTEKIVKNSPFSADAVSESIQVLADGNRIVRSSTNKLYRNGEGRFRREMGTGSGSVPGALFSYGPGITILDPVGGFRYMIDTDLRTARMGVLKPLTELKIRGEITLTTEQKAKIHEKLKSELKDETLTPEQKARLHEKLTTELKVVHGALAAVPEGVQAITGVLSTSPGGVAAAYVPKAHPKYDSRTEQLGKQNIDGVEAEGTRTITTIPAGAIGNERPIEIVYERWYSNDLQLVVKSKHSDPRFGDQTYRLTNIIRTEPDPSLFSLPAGYRVVNAPASVYTLSTTKSETERAVVRAAQAPAAVTRTTP